MPPCPFCARIAAGEIVLAADRAVALADAYPVAPGHTLVVPRACVADLFELPPEDRRAVWDLVDEVVAHLRQRLAPDGFNVGVNVGAAAGQTVTHSHVHVVPRRRGDVPDPRGGVRWVIPDKARYWRS